MIFAVVFFDPFVVDQGAMQKPDDSHDVGLVARFDRAFFAFVAAGDQRAEQKQKRRFDIKRGEIFAATVESEPLLEKREQVAEHQHIRFVLLVIAGKIQNEKIFAVAVAVKMAVGIIERDGARVFFGAPGARGGGEGLAESRAVFENKAAVAGEPIARFEVAAIAAGAFVPFVDENQVGAGEKIARYCHAFLFGGLVRKLVDVDDAHGVGRGEHIRGFVVAAARNVRSAQFVEVLLGHFGVGRDQNDIFRREQPIFAAHKLAQIDVHQERFAAAGGHPKGEFAEMLGIEARQNRRAGFFGVAALDERIQFGDQSIFGIGQALQKTLGGERGQVLKVFENDGLFAALVDCAQVGADVGIHPVEHIGGDFRRADARQNSLQNAVARIAPALAGFFEVGEHIVVRIVAQLVGEPKHERKPPLQARGGVLRGAALRSGSFHFA